MITEVRKMRNLENEKSFGFTLLEIMIALAIIGLTLVTVLHTVNYHSNVSYENIVTTQMVQSAKEKYQTSKPIR